MEKKEKPVREVKLQFSGAVLKAAIWRHENDDKPPRYSVSLHRVYRGEDGKWLTTEFFNRDDLLGLSRLVEVAHGWIVTQRNGGEDHE